VPVFYAVIERLRERGSADGIIPAPAGAEITAEAAE
jgi:hypothetical protein